GITRTTLQRHETDHAEQTLGIFLAPDRNTQQQVEYLKDKARAFAGHIRAGSLSRNDVWVAMKTTILKTMEYPMRATNITRDDWEAIYSPILAICLPRSGISRNFPRTVAFSPTEFQGLGIMHPWYQQELSHIQALLEENAKPLSVAKTFMQISAESLRLELGIGGPFTSIDYKTASAIATKGWWTSVWRSAQQFHIDIDDPYEPIRLIRDKDQFLMQAFLNNGFRGKTLHQLNECRMYLRAITLADITNAPGDYLLHTALTGKRSSVWHNYTWPRDPPHITGGQWTTWRNALRTCFSNPYETTTKLLQPLGNMLQATPDTWPWYYHVTSKTLYETTGDTWRTYQDPPRPTRTVSTQGTRMLPSANSAQLPSNCRPATAYRTPTGNAFYTGVTQAAHLHIPPIESQDNSLESHRNRINPASQWTIAHWDLPPDQGTAIATAIINGTAKAVSDGSYKSGHSTAGFILLGSNKDQELEGVNTTPGAKLEQSAYRAELSGIAGIASALSCLCKKHD
ncbi:MAG TPA: hypothetical protein V6D20_20565, partial [Candidatus Obscuribacterales bacterium]